MNYESVLTGIDKEIKEMLYGYIETRSYTYTAGEKEAERFLTDWFSTVPYFRKHPEFCGTYDIEGDLFQRKVCFGMVRGKGNKTVVLIHHSDVVGIEDFKLLKDYAHSPDELEKKLMEVKDSLPQEAGEDLESGEWLFGRGGCDMKGGGSIQWSLLKRYSEIEDFSGNVIVVAVPDEENMSSGMRAAVKLLAELKDRYDLDYRMMINSEPHQRKDREVGVFSEGTVGKMLPFVYVRGYLSHVGKVFEGLNPVNIVSEIVRRTELSMEFTDAVEDECAPPPTWLYLKDSKKVYDVSMPLSMEGCFSILTLDQTPENVIEKLRTICQESFDKVLCDMRESYERFKRAAKPVAKDLPWKTSVMSIGELCAQAEASHGDSFTKAYGEKLAELTVRIHAGEINVVESNFELVDLVFEYIDDMKPKVVYGLIPPYYPNVSNYYFQGLGERKDLSKDLDAISYEKFGQHYSREYFFTGICDLSFSGLKKGAAKEIEKSLREYMPMYGGYYDVPFEALEKIAMPCINIGPWGKDFHKLTERVLKEDLYVRTPALLDHAISRLL